MPREPAPGDDTRRKGWRPRRRQPGPGRATLGRPGDSDDRLRRHRPVRRGPSTADADTYRRSPRQRRPRRWSARPSGVRRPVTAGRRSLPDRDVRLRHPAGAADPSDHPALLVANPGNDIAAGVRRHPAVRRAVRRMFSLDRVKAAGSVLDIAAIVALVGWTLIEALILAALRSSSVGAEPPRRLARRAPRPGPRSRPDRSRNSRRATSRRAMSRTRRPPGRRRRLASATQRRAAGSHRRRRSGRR